MESKANPKPLPINDASTDSIPIDLTKLGLKIRDSDMKPPKSTKNIWQKREKLKTSIKHGQEQKKERGQKLNICRFSSIWFQDLDNIIKNRE